MEEQLSQWDQEQKALLFDDVDLEALLEEKEDFYLQEDGTVVVVFDKYEIAAGAPVCWNFPLGSCLRHEKIARPKTGDFVGKSDVLLNLGHLLGNVQNVVADALKSVSSSE